METADLASGVRVDPERHAILLTGGDKGGVDQRRFYARLIASADARLDSYLAAVKAVKTGKKAKESSRGKKS